MTFHKFVLSGLVALTCVAGSSHAALVSTNSSASFGPLVGTDTFSDLAINGFVTGPLARSTGGGAGGSSGAPNIPSGYAGTPGSGVNYAYTAATSNGDFFVVPNAGNPGLSTDLQASSITFSFTDLLNPVYSVGGNFFGTNLLGESLGGTFRLVATNSDGETAVTDFSTAAFYGFRSTGNARLTQLVLSSTSSAYATIDNLSVSPSAVPTPDSYLLMVAGLGALAFTVRRRKPV